MAEGVKLDIVLTDDGQPAERPDLPDEAGAPTPDGADGSLPPWAGNLTARELLEEISASNEDIYQLLLEGGGGGGKEKKEEQKSDPPWLSKLRTGAEAFESSARRTEGILASLANNDFMGTLRGSADAAASGLAMLGPYGAAAGVALQAVTAGVDAFGSVVNAFVDRGKQLSQFSPELAVSQVNREVTSLFADMREAEELGPGLARITDAQTELMDILREAMLPIKKAIVNILAPAMEFLVEQAKNGYILLNDVYSVLKAIPEILYDLITFNDQALAQVVDRISAEGKLTRDAARKFGPDSRRFEPIRWLQDVVDRVGRRQDMPFDRPDDPILGGIP
jgi:hypothetical protein